MSSEVATYPVVIPGRAARQRRRVGVDAGLQRRVAGKARYRA